MRIMLAMTLAALALLPAGCVGLGASFLRPRGLIYNHTTVPLTVNFNKTPVSAERPQHGNVKHFRYSYVDIRWDENGIGRIAKQHGIETIYYADKEVLSILGIWTQTYIHIYGTTEKAE